MELSLLTLANGYYSITGSFRFVETKKNMYGYDKEAAISRALMVSKYWGIESIPTERPLKHYHIQKVYY